ACSRDNSANPLPPADGGVVAQMRISHCRSRDTMSEQFAKNLKAEASGCSDCSVTAQQVVNTGPLKPGALAHLSPAPTNFSQWPPVDAPRKEKLGVRLSCP